MSVPRPSEAPGDLIEREGGSERVVGEEDRESNFIGRRTGIVTSSSFFGPRGSGEIRFCSFDAFIFCILTDLCFKRGNFNTVGSFIPTWTKRKVEGCWASSGGACSVRTGCQGDSKIFKLNKLLSIFFGREFQGAQEPCVHEGSAGGRRGSGN